MFSRRGTRYNLSNCTPSLFKAETYSQHIKQTFCFDYQINIILPLSTEKGRYKHRLFGIVCVIIEFQSIATESTLPSIRNRYRVHLLYFYGRKIVENFKMSLNIIIQILCGLRSAFTLASGFVTDDFESNFFETQISFLWLKLINQLC